jgi:hypothetical protein
MTGVLLDSCAHRVRDASRSKPFLWAVRQSRKGRRGKSVGAVDGSAPGSVFLLFLSRLGGDVGEVDSEPVGRLEEVAEAGVPLPPLDPGDVGAVESTQSTPGGGRRSKESRLLWLRNRYLENRSAGLFRDSGIQPPPQSPRLLELRQVRPPIPESVLAQPAFHLGKLGEMRPVAIHFALGECVRLFATA